MINENRNLKRVQKIIEEFRKLDGEMPMQMASTFLAIACSERITMKDVSEKVGISQSSISRNVGALGHRHRYGKEGFKLVRTEEDEIDIRRKIAYLTPKGSKFVAGLLKIIEED